MWSPVAEREPGVRSDLLAVDGDAEAEVSHGLPQVPGTHLDEAAGRLDRHPRRLPAVRLGVLVRGVDVAQGVRLGAGLLEHACSDAIEQHVRPAFARRQELFAKRQQGDPIRRRERMPAAVSDGRSGVVVRADRTENGGHERRIEKRHVHRRHEGDVGPPLKRCETGGQAAKRAVALRGIVDDLDVAGQVGQLLTGRSHRDDLPVAHDAGENAGDPRGQRLPVPVESRLRAAHPRRPAADEQDCAGPHPGESTRKRRPAKMT